MTRYKGIWKSFTTFAGVEPDWAFPSTPQLLAQYGVWLADQGYKPATIATHLAGVGWWHKVKGLEDPSRSYLVKRLLIGLAKEGPPPKQATPIRYSQLRSVLEQLPAVANAYDAKLYRAAFLLAYFASLRVCEYADTKSKHALQLKDVGFVVDGGVTCVSLTLPSYKGSNRRKAGNEGQNKPPPPPVKLLVPPNPPSACPVAALKEYLKVRPRGGGLLFLRKPGAPLTSAVVNTRLRACIAAMGLPPAEFSSHSFRAGRTTDLVEMNVADTQIRESGRWKSDAFLQYVRFDVFRLPAGGPAGCGGAYGPGPA